jgi:hypothetical protein
MPEALPANDTLYVVTTINNPLLWHSRYRLARAAVLDWLKEPNVHVTVVEVAHGHRSHVLSDLTCQYPERVKHIEVHAATMAWSKENCLNIGIQSLPHSARYIGTFDADVHWRLPGWASQIVHTLNLYHAVQPWQTCYDLGPNDEHVQTHTSFCYRYFQGENVIHCEIPAYGTFGYPHPGYAWAWTREALDGIGGLYELGGMGSGDYHMALGLIGKADRSIPHGVTKEFAETVHVWQRRALRAANKKIGYVPLTIEHEWHGDKARRGYLSRWDIFLQHKFNPIYDLRRNSWGVLEFDGNKPDLERAFDCYLRSRQEDANVIA